MKNITRRRFLEDSMLAAAAASAAALSPVPLLAQTEAPGANSRIRVGVIGCRIRGKVHAREFAKLPGCEVAYVCDPDRDLAAELAAETAKQQSTRPQTVDCLSNKNTSAGILNRGNSCRLIPGAPRSKKTPVNS
ncbi:MAG: twin-arginine translocation signal domain-containing protein [Verrucomicrobia bacterium]|nr:twin-arginine translocation signal domain-containing protein [Verrucomicrobiota bacterium]